MTQTELSERAGISRQAIVALERGYSEPHPKTTRALAKALGVAASALYGEES